MARQDKKIPLGLQIGLILMLLIFVVIGVMSGILFDHFQKNAQKSVYEAIDVAVSANSREIQGLIGKIKTATDLINENECIFLKENAASEELAGLVCRYEEQMAAGGIYDMVKLYNEWEFKCEEYFYYCFGDHFSDYYCKVYVKPEYNITRWLSKIDEFAEPISNKKVGILSGESVEGDSWYQQAEETKGETIWFVLDQYPTRLSMAKELTYSYIDQSEMSVRTESFAVLGLWFDIQWIVSSIDSTSITENASVWLMDGENRVIYTTNAEISETFCAFDRLVESETVNCFIGENEFLAQKKSLGENLYMVTVVPVNDVTDMAMSVVKIILLVAIAMMLVGACLSITLGIFVVRPIRFLADHMGSGQLRTIKGKQAKSREVSVLYGSFNGLVVHIRDLMENLVEASEIKKAAEIHALQAQINPHFIYNTLNAVAGLEMLSGRREVAGILNSLSQMIRYNIKEPDKLVTLEEELASILNYVKIQQFCSSKSFGFSYHIDPDKMHYRLPKVIIQPLIENALIHGSQMAEGNGNVSLSVFAKDEELCIRVWDNGICADVEWINMYIRGDADVERYTDSLGVRNVYERIKMVYGEKADLVFSQDENECTVATIILPLEVIVDGER